MTCYINLKPFIITLFSFEKHDLYLLKTLICCDHDFSPSFHVHMIFRWYKNKDCQIILEGRWGWVSAMSSSSPRLFVQVLLSVLDRLLVVSWTFVILQTCRQSMHRIVCKHLVFAALNFCVWELSCTCHGF